MTKVDPNGVGIKGNLFGLPYIVEDADIVLIPVPWDVTVSYTAGTSEGPEAILEASSQVDLSLGGLKEPWLLKTVLLPFSKTIIEENEKYRALAVKYINALEDGVDLKADDPLMVIPKTINEVCEKLNIYIKKTSSDFFEQGKIVGVVGGDHSTPLGLLRELNRRIPEFGILQIDAHADLRNAYENFAFSHASIMRNTLKLKAVSKLVQVGVRDYCDEELKVIEKNPERVRTFFNDQVTSRLFQGETWHQVCSEIVAELPELVYLSLDIDGLDPSLGPNTGTPVPGGLSFDQFAYLLKMVVKEGKTIIGFDLCEVAPGEGEWDANVGARLLYLLSCWTGASQGKILAAH